MKKITNMINVVIADDEKNVVKLIRNLVDWSQYGMRIAADADNGADALALVHAHNARLLVTDLRMPGMDGARLIATARAECPDVAIIVISGYRSSSITLDTDEFSGIDIIFKPVIRERLEEALDRARVRLSVSSNAPYKPVTHAAGKVGVISEHTKETDAPPPPIPEHRYVDELAFVIVALLGVLIVLMAGMMMYPQSTVLHRRIAALIGLAAFAAIIYFGVRKMYARHHACEHMLNLYHGGYISLKDVFSIKDMPSRGVERAFHKLSSARDEQELIAMSRRQAQYLALQNQINPHFLYNTLEGIRGEALSVGLESVAGMAEKLAALFRYTISNTDQLVTLKDELDNTRNYFRIQQFRFGPKIQMCVHCDDENRERLLKCKIPKIILQPIVENSIIHGLEERLAPGWVEIRIVASLKRLMITVSDNGVGIEETLLEQINQKLRETSIEYHESSGNGKGPGIAMLNVNNRIRLMFGDEYGVTIYSTKNEGTDVLITVPLIEADSTWETTSEA